MKDVSKETRTIIELDPQVDDDGSVLLIITGRIPDVYTARLRLMWALNDGKRESKPPADATDAMQQQMDLLKSQLEAFKSGHTFGP